MTFSIVGIAWFPTFAVKRQDEMKDLAQMMEVAGVGRTVLGSHFG